MRRLAVLLFSFIVIVPALFVGAIPVQAAASMSVSSSSNVIIGNNLTVSVYVNTGGQTANTFQGTISYPASYFDGVKGSFSGSICSLPVMQPDPSGGSATFACGSPGGFSGSGLVATITLKATSPGEGSLGLSGCTVLANDGKGTDITGGCSGTGITINDAPTPTPVPATPAPTPVPVATPKVTPKPGTTVQATKAAETPAPTAAPTAQPTPPPATALPVDNATVTSGTPAPSSSAAPSAPKRGISQAFRDMFMAVQSFRLSGRDYSGTAALLLTLLPFMAFLFAIVFFAYRLYRLERRRHRTMDRLFELELSELAALEGKMDLLAEKGTKGREEYRDEFNKTKEHILRQLRPDYGKPIEEASTPKSQPPAEEKKQ